MELLRTQDIKAGEGEQMVRASVPVAAKGGYFHDLFFVSDAWDERIFPYKSHVKNLGLQISIAAIPEIAMNTIREIQNLNKRELEANVSIAGSWHRDFDDTAYVYIGGLPFDLSEGDIITIFSQYGEPTYVNLIRDKDSGKSKGFAFLKYEDQRSTDLAVDNLGGASIMGRVLKVDHTRYKRKDGEEEEEREREMNGGSGTAADEDGEREEEDRRPLLKEEVELMKLEREHDEDDPMKEFLVQEKREQVAEALARLKGGERKREIKHKHHHRHEDRKRDRHSEERDDRRHRHRHSHRRRSRSP